jgi:hypothetical protein
VLQKDQYSEFGSESETASMQRELAVVGIKKVVELMVLKTIDWN